MSDGLRELFQRYLRRYPVERRVVRRFSALLSEGRLAFSRDRREGHLTASAWVVDAEKRSVLLVHHRKLDRWLQPGGHADGEEDLLSVAQKEVLEETGVSTSSLEPVEILDLDIHPIPPRGELPGHDHYDVRFLLVAGAGETARGNEETWGAIWVPIDRLEEITREESILRMRSKAGELLRRASPGAT
ncbi:MAG: NUDIX hydrolase [Alkalispirochaetaceae bacterium]